MAKTKTAKKSNIVEIKHVGETTEIVESFLPEGNQEGDQVDAGTADGTNQEQSPAPTLFVLIGKEGSIWGIGTSQEGAIEDANNQGPKRKFSMKNTWKEYKQGEASLIPCSELLYQDVQGGDGSVPYVVVDQVAYTEDEAKILLHDRFGEDTEVIVEAATQGKSDSTETETAATESTAEAPGEIDAFASPPGMDYQDGTDNRKPVAERESRLVKKSPLSLGELPESSGTFLAELERRNKNRIAAERGVDHMKAANLYSKEAEKAYNDARKKLKETAEEDLPMVSTDINRLLWAFRRVCEHAKVDAGAVFDLARREIPVDSDVEEHQALMEEKAREEKKRPREVEGQTKLKFDDGSEAEAASECVTTSILGELPEQHLPVEMVEDSEFIVINAPDGEAEHKWIKPWETLTDVTAEVIPDKAHPEAHEVWIEDADIRSVEVSIRDNEGKIVSGKCKVTITGTLARVQETGESTQSEPDETATSSPADTSESEPGKSADADAINSPGSTLEGVATDPKPGKNDGSAMNTEPQSEDASNEAVEDATRDSAQSDDAQEAAE